MKIRALVKQIRHVTKRGAGGWYILITDQGCCKGTVGWSLTENTLLRLTGNWEVSKFNGAREFKFHTAELEIETDPRALLHLACLETKGLGGAKESLIWDVYGEDWQEATLEEIPGLRQSTRDLWADTLRRLKDMDAQVRTTAWLLSKGCSKGMADAAWNQWHTGTQGIVSENPYVLADLPNFNFTHVDGEITEAFGITRDDPRRYRAGARYIMKQITNSSNNTLCDKESLAYQMMQWCPEHSEQIDPAINSLLEDKELHQLGNNLVLSEDYRNAIAVYNRFWGTTE
jgi:hypothetical protein